MAVKVLVSRLADWSRQNHGIIPGPLNALATGLSWSYFLAILFLFDPLLRVTFLFGQKAFHKSASLMCKLLHGIVYLTFSRIQIEGREIPDPGQRYLIVINHQSLLEGILPVSVLGALRPVFICKKELGFGIPSVSFFLRNGQHCLIDRLDAVQSLKELGLTGKRLNAGEVSPVFLPEGTRSKDGRLLRFKRAGLVQLMDRAPDCPVLPVLIDGGYALFPKGFGWVRANTCIKMRILPPMTKEPAEDAVEFVERLEGLFRSELEDLRSTDCKQTESTKVPPLESLPTERQRTEETVARS